MIGDYVYFVTTNYRYYYLEDEPVMPRILENGMEKTVTCASETKCILPDIYYFDIPYPSYDFTSITAVNINDISEPIENEYYMMSSSQNMYVSENNIYITYTKYISEYQLELEVMKEIVYPRLSATDRERVDKIEATENYILTPEEKLAKISMIIERFGQSLSGEEQTALERELEAKMKQKYEDIAAELEKTVIHKIAINDGVKSGDGRLEYETQGEVTGQVLNQFSMDESEGYFRIATTKNRAWSRFEKETDESYSNLFVLDGGLKPVGALTKLASGERIYSVRFMQNRAYMVTFKQTDPLFVIDLENPKNPRVLGELKIPGFSNYLHPYDEKTLIGIGKDTAENEWGGVTTKGLKLSLFDVADVANPKEVDTLVLGDAGSDSIALNDHKAFLFSREKNLLVLPVSLYENAGTRYGNMAFSGAAVFDITATGIELKGKIDHSDGGKSSSSDFWGGYNYYDNSVKRSLYISDTLYTFSNNYLKMNKLGDLSEVNSVRLVKEKGDDYEVIN